MGFKFKIAAGVLAFSLIAFFSVYAQNPPTAPSGLAAQAVSYSEVDVSWNDNSSDEVNFLLYRAQNSSFFGPTITPLGPNYTSYSDRNLNANTTYYYKVYACNAAGCVPSNSASVTTPPPPPQNTPFSYGVRLDKNTLKFSGQAWGSALVGWINFSNPDIPYAVEAEVVNRAPAVTNVTIEAVGEVWCLDTNLGGLDEPYYRVRWNYTDPDGDTQSQAEVQFIKTGTGEVSASASITGPDTTYLFFDPLGYIATGSYNSAGYLATATEYKARVRIDDGKAWSSVVDSTNAVLTAEYYYPLVDFTWSPNPTGKGTLTIFTDNSLNRSAGQTSLTGRTWQFENVNRPPTNESTQTVVFTDLPAQATLTITDSNGKSCTLEQTVNPGGEETKKRRKFRERGN